MVLGKSVLPYVERGDCHLQRTHGWLHQPQDAQLPCGIHVTVPPGAMSALPLKKVHFILIV